MASAGPSVPEYGIWNPVQQPDPGINPPQPHNYRSTDHAPQIRPRSHQAPGRHRTLLAWLLLLLALPALAARGPDLPDYPADQVAPGLYAIHGPVGYPSPENQGFMNNPAFLVTETGVIVVDPGSSVQTGEMVLRQIRKVTDKPLLAVLNTHVHGDHWLGNQAMVAAAPEVPIYAHPKMLEQVARGAGEEWVQRMMSATNGATEGTVPRGPTIALEGGETLSLGGLTFKTHYYPHVHTTTDLMFEVPELGALFLGTTPATDASCVWMTAPSAAASRP